MDPDTTTPYATARSVYDELGNPNSEICQESLKHKCGICGAKPQEPCIQIINGYPLTDRYVHYMRMPIE